MSLEDKAKATAKKVEGSIQEGAGNLAGDREAEAKGKAKKRKAKRVKMLRMQKIL